MNRILTYIKESNPHIEDALIIENSGVLVLVSNMDGYPRRLASHYTHYWNKPVMVIHLLDPLYLKLKNKTIPRSIGEKMEFA